MASNNMYRVGDFVYFESSATAPYQIRRIDELNKTPTGAVEAKVACYYRRRDISITLINQAERYYLNETDSDDDSSDTSSSGKRHGSQLADLDRHRIKHRELFLSRQVECLPATHIRGKCSVTLYNDAEPLSNYLAREDAFYYKLIYDPSQRTLQEDRGSMRIGPDHQSEIQPLLAPSEIDPRFSSHLEESTWIPGSLSDAEVDMFCLMTRAVGTLGRAFGNHSETRQPLLLGAAAAAGRDMTKQHAHDLLHKANYDIRKAISLLLPGGQPLICQDQLEEWSASEAHLFEEALDKYSKAFPDIRSDCLPWKTQKSLVELYYFWKTTDRYVRQRRTKLIAQEHKLKQVYIPNYCKPNPSVLYTGSDKTGRGCEGCAAITSSQWYAWGPQNLLYRLCSTCWTYWKRYGGLKNMISGERSTAMRTTPNMASSLYDTDSKPSLTSENVESGTRPICGEVCTAIGVSPKVGMRHPECSVGLATPAAVGSRGTQCFKTPAFIRVARILCPWLLRPSLLARCPGKQAALTALRESSRYSEPADVASAVTLSTVRAAAQPILARLSDPSSLLTRTRDLPPVDEVVSALAVSKGIVLQPLDLNSARPNGPVPTKRSPSPYLTNRDSPSKPKTKHGIAVSGGRAPPDASNLLNGSRLSTHGTSPPPCKKQALGTCSPFSESSNGLTINDRTTVQDK